MKKKWLMYVVAIIVILLLAIGSIFIYIKPSQHLTMEYEPIIAQEKLVGMITQLSREVVFNEEEINALVKASIDPQLTEQIYIEGAHFHVEDDLLHGLLNVSLYDKVKAELRVSYLLQWEEPSIRLIPVSIKTKNIELPISLLEEINTPLYDVGQSIILIESITTQDNELIVKLGVNLLP